MGSRNRSSSRGFTLVELMIAVAIVAILASVAFPSYSSYVKRGKRTAAQSFMQTLGNKEEQQMLNTRCYFSYPTDAACAPPTITMPTEVSNNYTITITASNAATPPTYTLTATPTTNFSDPECGTLTLTNTGVKDKSGTGTVANCWK